MKQVGLFLLLLSALSLGDEGHNHGEEEAGHSHAPAKVKKSRKAVKEGVGEDAAPAEKESEFHVEKGMLETIYQGSVSQTAATMPNGLSSLVVSPQIAITSPHKLRLVNNYFDVSHTDSLQGVPAFGIGVGAPLWSGSGFSLSSAGKVGYAFRESITQVKSSSGSTFADLVKVHWLSVGAGLTADYEVLTWLRPFLGGDAGMQWIYQSGKLDGLEQGFWVPYYEAKAGLTLFSRPRTLSEWFGGVTVGGSLRRSFASQQETESSSVDVGLSVYL